MPHTRLDAARQNDNLYVDINNKEKKNLPAKASEGLPRPDRQCWHTRYTLVLLLSLAYATARVQRICFNLGLVAMVNFTAVDNVSNGSEDTCSQNMRRDNATFSSHPKEGEFHWDENTQSLLLAAFFYGYVILQMPGGYLADRLSAKLLLTIAVISPSIVTLLTPVVARWNVNALVALRFAGGLLSGPLMPAMNSLLGKWVPQTERAKSYAFLVFVSSMASIVAPYVTGFLCDSHFLGGWPSAFYVFGAPGLLWLVFWLTLIHEKPESHPRITSDEIRYIQATIPCRREKSATPFKDILLSVPVWSTVFTFLFDNIGFSVIFSTFPLYLREILKVDAETNGMVSTLMNGGIGVVVAVCGILSDYILKRRLMKVTWSRKLATAVSHGCLGVTMLLVAFSACNGIVAIATVIIGYSISGAGTVGFNLGPMDMAPQFAGTLMGLCNTAGNIGGFLSPEIVGALTENKANFRSWQTVFYITSGVYFTSVINYLLFSSSERQKWATEETEYTTIINDDQDILQKG